MSKGKGEKTNINNLILDLNSLDLDKKLVAIQKLDKILASVPKERIKSELIPYITSNFNLSNNISRLH